MTIPFITSPAGDFPRRRTWFRCRESNCAIRCISERKCHRASNGVADFCNVTRIEIPQQGTEPREKRRKLAHVAPHLRPHPYDSGANAEEPGHHIALEGHF